MDRKIHAGGPTCAAPATPPTEPEKRQPEADFVSITPEAEAQHREVGFANILKTTNQVRAFFFALTNFICINNLALLSMTNSLITHPLFDCYQVCVRPYKRGHKAEKPRGRCLGGHLDQHRSPPQV